MPNPLRLNIDAIPKNYNVEDLFRLAMEQNIFIGHADYEPITFGYTLKELSLMPFEQWAYLIEIENQNICGS